MSDIKDKIEEKLNEKYGDGDDYDSLFDDIASNYINGNLSDVKKKLRKVSGGDLYDLVKFIEDNGYGDHEKALGILKFT